MRCSLIALAVQCGSFIPFKHEAMFGIQGQPPLVVKDETDQFKLRGFIDRVDRAPGGQIQIIDYKTGGPSPFTNTAIQKGKKLQIPLYALAARDALHLGEPVDGFYWHVQHAKPSPFSLGKFKGGAKSAIGLAVGNAWEAVRGARTGRFEPHPPVEGCPAYCPAAAFCWHRKAGFRG